MAISIKKSKVGSLHKHLGISKDKKIPRSRLTIKSGDSPAIRKKKQFALNARKWSHAEGGPLGDTTSTSIVRNTTHTPITEKEAQILALRRGLLGEVSDTNATMQMLSKQPPEYLLDYFTPESGLEYTRRKKPPYGTANRGGYKLWKTGETGDVLKNMGYSNINKYWTEQGNNTLVNHGLGGWLRNAISNTTKKEHRGDLFKTAAGIGLMFGPGTQGMGMGMIGSGIEGLTSEDPETDKSIEKSQFDRDVYSRLSTLQQAPSYMPVAKQGGFTIYKGETHKGPTGGILTDEQGNPAGLSTNPAIALTERNEVARYNPDTKSTYIYSENLGFAKPARELVKKYKLNKENSLYKYDNLLKTAVDKQFDNLMTAQEFAKETKTPVEDAMGIFKSGGSLTAEKAGEMLRDGTAHGHPLTARQKRYLGWIRGGRKEDGGILDELSHGSYIRKRRGAVYPFLPIPSAPIGAYVGEDGGYIPLFDSGGNLTEIRKRPGGSNAGKYKGVHSFAGPSGGAPAGSYPINTLKRGRAALAYAHNAPNPSGIRSAVYRKYPQLKKEFGGYLPIYQGKPGEPSYIHKPFTLGERLLDPFNAAFGIENRPNPFNNFAQDIPLSGNSIRNTRYNFMGAPVPFYSIPTAKPKGKPYINPEAPENLPYPIAPGVGLREPTGGGINRITGPNKLKYNPKLSLDWHRPFDLEYNTLAKGPTMPATQEEQYNPTLSPLGHLLSGVGQLADYRALGKAKPVPVSLPRMGAERISLARQRLINERNAAGQRNMNTTLGRNLGANAGVAMANITSANTGVNRLLGQENMTSLMNEESTNAQLQQQANAMNAEIAAQEGFYNNEQLNAYRMAKARMNPLGNLSRTAASYFADNSAYGQGYDTMQMLAPNAELYAPENDSFVNRLLGTARPQVRFRDKTLKR